MNVTAVLGAIFGIAALLIATVALTQSGGGRDGTGASAATVTPSVVEVELGDIFIKPGDVSAEAGRPVSLQVTNAGAIQHNLVIEGGAETRMLNSGESETLDLGALDAGSYTLFCAVPGHRDGGMKATLTVGAAGEIADHSEHETGGRMLHNDDAYMAGINAFPAATERIGGQPLAPVMDGDVKVFELTAEEIQWEVEPGVYRDAMAYNGQVPGPEIRVRLGDRVRIVLHNQLPESTSLHYHGLVVPNEQDGVPGLTQPLIPPGASHTYEFTVVNSGSHMYHSHMNSSMQVPMGLLGAFIVEDGKEAPVDQDVTMILNDGPLGFTINGKGFPATQPIVAKQGEKIRVRYMNEGLQMHPMHLHGVPQLVVAKDGYPLPQPHYEDTVAVAPGERIDVLIDATELGAWAFHCHILSHAEGPNGMFGMVTVMQVNQ